MYNKNKSFMEARPDRREFWKEFAMLYYRQRILWAPEQTSGNKYARRKSYEVLLNKMREMYPEANLNFTKRKVLSLRAAARREDRKIRAYRKLHKEYKPIWYLYPYLEFIYGNQVEAEELEESESTDRDMDGPRSIEELDGSEIMECELDESDEREQKAPLFKEFKAELNDDHTYEAAYVNDPLTEQCPENSFQLPKGRTDAQKLEYFYPDFQERDVSSEQSLVNFGKKNDEEAQLLGESWCLEYKRLSRDQQIYARRAIEEIFFEAKLGMLQRGSVKINQSSD